MRRPVSRQSGMHAEDLTSPDEPMNPTLSSRALALLAHRQEAVEVKVSFIDDTLEQLNDIVARQQAVIDRLVQEIAEMRRQQPTGDAAGFRSLRDELPPHY
jgi:SlyX protein